MTRKVNSGDIERLHEFGLYIPTRTIYMGSVQFDEDSNECGVDAALSERIIDNLLILDNINHDPITILINNVGGDPWHACAIYDAIQTSESKIIGKVYGQAMSAGSIILQAADVRIMAPNSVQMIHYGDWGAEGHAKTSQKQAKESERIDKWMENIYLSRINEKDSLFKKARLQRMLDHDTFLTAQQSLDLGLCDKIMEKVK